MNKILFLSILAIVLEGCRTALRRARRADGRASTDSGVADPVGAPPIQTPQDEAPSAPSANSARRVAVILGPGGGKSFAHVGVLKALQQQRVPIEKVVGLEWGALMGGLFAIKGTTHDVEWKLYKLEQNNPLTQSKVSSRAAVARTQSRRWITFFGRLRSRRDG